MIGDGLSTTDSSVSHQSSFSLVPGPDHHKRKFDDYVFSYPDYSAQLLQRMKRREVYTDNLASQSRNFSRSDEILEANGAPSSSGECSSVCESSNRRRYKQSESTQLHFFVRMMTRGETIVIHANKNETVQQIHQRIEWKTRIPVMEQRLLYCGKQLQCEQSLGYYSIEQDASLNLVARMRSTEYPVAWQTVDDIMYAVSQLCKGETLCQGVPNINDMLNAFVTAIPKENSDSMTKYLLILSNSSVPAALVMLYASSLEGNKDCAKNALKIFLTGCTGLPKPLQNNCLPAVLEFCRLFRKVAHDQTLYLSCRDALGSMMDTCENFGGLKYADHGGWSSFAQKIFPFFADLAGLLVNELVQRSGPSVCDVHNFSSFWDPLRKAIQFQGDFSIPIDLHPRKRGKTHALEVEVRRLYGIFKKFLIAMDICMGDVESWLSEKEAGVRETMPGYWSQYLAILKIINSISNFYQGAKEQVANMLKIRKASFSALILKFAERCSDHQWIFEYKEATNFEARRHLVMFLFPYVKEDFDEVHEMLIDRSNLLAESFEYIKGASPKSFSHGLYMEFKNEEATGPGVLREWFLLVCRELFSSQNTLFVRSADDCRRFSPNPVSKVDPMHREFFAFTGRMIALALMYKVQIDVLLDRVFFLQLAGIEVSLEDIKDTDRCMYKSLKEILEMDPEFLDSNAGLGLTFMLETETLGRRETIELCPGGKSIAVNSKNRKQYVDLFIKHRFIFPISDQVYQFSQGFKDLLTDFNTHRSFFKNIYLEDLDWMLRGGENPISIDDWKAHTHYNGYQENSAQIRWFWKILRRMTQEELRNLLFFWTSIKFVPVEGFRGLSSKLSIHRSHQAQAHLPSSHTCFYQLCLPRYRTNTLLEKQLRVITQDHVSSSFGTA